MPVINVSDLIEGRITEADYYSVKGQLLIAKGEVPTGNHLSVLQRRNIFEIHLHHGSDTETAGVLEKAQKVDLSGGKAPTPDLWNIAAGKEGYEQLLSGRSVTSPDQALRLNRIINKKNVIRSH